MFCATLWCKEEFNGANMFFKKSLSAESSKTLFVKFWSAVSAIRDYSEDRPLPSALFLGYIDGKPLHVVAALDEKNKEVFVITAYEPSLDVFESDYRTRRKS